MHTPAIRGTRGIPGQKVKGTFAQRVRLRRGRGVRVNPDSDKCSGRRAEGGGRAWNCDLGPNWISVIRVAIVRATSVTIKPSGTLLRPDFRSKLSMYRKKPPTALGLSPGPATLQAGKNVTASALPRLSSGISRGALALGFWDKNRPPACFGWCVRGAFQSVARR